MSSPFGDSTGSSSVDSAGSLDTGSTSTTGEGLSSAPTAPSDGVPATSTSSQADNSSSSGHNPAWDGLLQKIPTQFHGLITDDLKQWDRNYGQLAQQYAPYKRFASQNVSPDALSSAWDLFQIVNNNPMEVYRRLGEALKDQLPQQQPVNTAPVDDEYDYEDGDGEDNGQNDERYQTMESELTQLRQMFQQQVMQQQQEAATQHYSRQIDDLMNRIESEHGKFNRGDVLQRVAAQMQMGQEPDIWKAYQEQQEFIKSIAGSASTPGNPAPKVMTPNGGLPSTTTNTSTQTFDDRVARFKELLGHARNG